MVRFGLGSEQVLHEREGTDFVEVAFARSLDEARAHCAVLRSNAIPALIEAGAEPPARRGIAVLVPTDRLVEASEFLTIQAQIEDDEDDDDDDFDDDEEEEEDEDYDDLDDDEDDLDPDDDDEDDLTAENDDF